MRFTTSIKALAVAICVLCVSNAKAALLLDWSNGTLGTPATGVSSTTPSILWHFTGVGGRAVLDKSQTTVSITANSGYNITGLTLNVTLAHIAPAGYGITVTGSGGFSQTFSAPGGSSSAISLANISSGNSLSYTFTLTGGSGPNNSQTHTVDFSDVSFSGTTTPVPEPIEWALIMFGTLAVIAKFVLPRLHRIAA